MNDKELLAYAAKAAGIKIYESTDGTIQNRPVWVFSAGGGMGTMSYEERWNPLTDDSQALRLWVKLKLDISFGDVSFFDDDFGFPVTYWREAQDVKLFVRHESDPYAATRRAIVRAAAEIGRSMK